MTLELFEVAGVLLVGALAARYVSRQLFTRRVLRWRAGHAAMAVGGHVEENGAGWRLATDSGVVIEIQPQGGPHRIEAIECTVRLPLFRGRFAILPRRHHAFQPQPDDRGPDGQLSWPGTVFDAKFRVTADAPDAVRELLTSRTRSWFASWGERSSAISDGNELRLLIPRPFQPSTFLTRSVEFLLAAARIGSEELEAAARDVDGRYRHLPEIGPTIETARVVPIVCTRTFDSPPGWIVRAPRGELPELPAMFHTLLATVPDATVNATDLEIVIRFDDRPQRRNAIVATVRAIEELALSAVRTRL